MFLLTMDWGPMLLSLKLASITALILLIVLTPLAWWLAFSQTRLKVVVEALVALPLVLPSTVLGFYLLVILGPEGFIGSIWFELTDQTLTFNFTGLVIASCIYSIPFVAQPLQTQFESVGKKPLEAAYTLGAKPLQAFYKIILPLSLRGYITAAVLGFAHTLGEFGVLLMVGGNIPGQTRVVAIAIYDYVEILEYNQAHQLSLVLLVIAFSVLFLVFFTNKSYKKRTLEC